MILDEVALSWVCSRSDWPKHYIPGSFHFTTLLSAFQPLFFRVSKQLDVSEVQRDGVLSIFKVSGRIFTMLR